MNLLSQIYIRLFDWVRCLLSSEDIRTFAVKRNIIGSLILKCISILVTLQVVPLTINYINPIRYGIWLTLSSIISWMSYFDLGLAHGFRNRFTEAKAKGDIKLAKAYVSTTYAVLFILFSVIFIISIIINSKIEWSNFLNIDKSYNEELKVVFGILACFFCMNIIASVFTTMLTADQKPALASLIHTSGQILAFICIYILTKTTSGNLSYLAFAFSGIPCLLLIVVSIIVFASNKYRDVAPSMKSVRFGLTRKILGLGGQFFIIMIMMVFIFQFINIILSRIEGPEAVTKYNIAYKYFNVLHMFTNIIVAPFWSAFTDAYVKEDYVWMKKVLVKLELLQILCVPILFVMVLFSNHIYSWWLNDSVEIPMSLSICMSIFVLCHISGDTYMYLINGTSKVRLQLIIYLLFAIISIPTMQFACSKLGIEGVLIIPIIVVTTQAIIGKIQLNKILNKTANGIWNK